MPVFFNSKMRLKVSAPTAARVIVRKAHGLCIAGNGLFDDDARVHAGFGQCDAKERVDGDDSVTCIEPQRNNALLVTTQEVVQ